MSCGLRITHYKHHFTNNVFRFLLFALVLLTAACTATPPITTPGTIHMQVTDAADPWLKQVINCQGSNFLSVEVRTADLLDPHSADIVIRIGQPEHLSSPVYQIGTDELLVIVNPQNPTQSLTASQVGGLFTGQIRTWETISGTSALVQVWSFPADEDVQQIFEQTVLGGSPLTSSARLANNQHEMVQAVTKDVNAIGIITQREKVVSGNIKDVFTAASSLLVLAITASRPQGTLASISACLQK
ncbi:MAG: substrate-binding domain-containing protein [Anaerolineales bacterium]